MKTVIIGAGSFFGGRLSKDIMASEILRDSKLCLCDINEKRLNSIKNYVERIVEEHNLPTEIEASTDRTELLKGADFVITSVSVGGGAYYGHPYKDEIEIPRKYGIDQAVADTCGVGAVFRFLRTGPVHLQIFRDIERLSPDALVLNHTNPMAMLTWLHHQKTSVENVGLCHGIQGTSRTLSNMLGVPIEEVTYSVAGINHLAWFLKLERNGKDLYPDLWEIMKNPEKSAKPKMVEKEKVRFEIMKQFGYFSTESSRHDSEYMPYFRRNQELMDKYNLNPRKVPENHVRDWLADNNSDAVVELERSQEFTTSIMEAVLSNKPFKFNGNVMNTGLITNLPDNCCVEVPCLVDKQGIQPCYVGDLPTQLAAIDRSNVTAQELAVEAVLKKDREAAFHAVALSPITSAKLSLPKIRKMFNELWEAESHLLRWFDPSHEGPVPEICAD